MTAIEGTFFAVILVVLAICILHSIQLEMLRAKVRDLKSDNERLERDVRRVYESTRKVERDLTNVLTSSQRKVTTRENNH